MMVLTPKGSVVLSYLGRLNPMKYFTYKQSTITDFYHSFDSTRSQITFDSLVTSTDGYKDSLPCQNNNSFHHRHKQNYSRRTYPYEVWRIPEEPDDCSRADIARTYRLGAGF